jgi:hypothetical protein
MGIDPQMVKLSQQRTSDKEWFCPGENQSYSQSIILSDQKVDQIVQTKRNIISSSS